MFVQFAGNQYITSFGNLQTRLTEPGKAPGFYMGGL